MNLSQSLRWQFEESSMELARNLERVVAVDWSGDKGPGSARRYGQASGRAGLERSLGAA